MRHSPSRGQQPTGGYQYDDNNYDGNYDEEDDLVDNAMNRYTDYTPAAPYPYKQQQQNYHGTEMV